MKDKVIILLQRAVHGWEFLAAFDSIVSASEFIESKYDETWERISTLTLVDVPPPTVRTYEYKQAHGKSTIKSTFVILECDVLTIEQE